MLVAHYEELGDRVLRLLGEEDRGRVYHRQWCARVFAEALVGLKSTDRKRHLAQVVAICDVYMWKLLCRDAGLSRDQTELALIELFAPLTKEEQ